MKKIGKIDITLGELLKQKGLSKTKFAREARIHYTQSKNYSENNMQKIDLVVLAKMCDTLECGISDILKYTPPEE